MAEITASLVKELRERTGAGMMDCKKALTEANGDIELAIENMRKSGAIKAAKKAGNVAADGVIKTKIDGNYGIILEVNCQTDFVAKDAGFQAFWKATFWAATSTVRVSAFWLPLKALTKSWLSSWQCTLLQASQNSSNRKTYPLKW